MMLEQRWTSGSFVRGSLTAKVVHSLLLVGALQRFTVLH